MPLQGKIICGEKTESPVSGEKSKLNSGANGKGGGITRGKALQEKKWWEKESGVRKSEATPFKRKKIKRKGKAKMMGWKVKDKKDCMNLHNMPDGQPGAIEAQPGAACPAMSARPASPYARQGHGADCPVMPADRCAAPSAMGPAPPYAGQEVLEVVSVRRSNTPQLAWRRKRKNYGISWEGG